jgi:hypothetical protein
VLCGVFANEHKNNTKQQLSHNVESDSTWHDDCQFAILQQAELLLIAKYWGMGGGGKLCCQKISSSPKGFLAVLFAKNEIEKKNCSHYFGRNKWIKLFVGLISLLFCIPSTSTFLKNSMIVFCCKGNWFVSSHPTIQIYETE